MKKLMIIVLLILTTLLNLGISASVPGSISGREELNFEEATVVSIRDLWENPQNYQGRLLFVFGEFKGWQGKGIPHPRITRSDWVIKDETGGIYVTGLPAPVKLGKLVNLWAVLKINEKGVSYLEAEKTEAYINLVTFAKLHKKEALAWWKRLFKEKGAPVLSHSFKKRGAVKGKLTKISTEAKDQFVIYQFGYHLLLPLSALLEKGDLSILQKGEGGLRKDDSEIGVRGIFLFKPIFQQRRGGQEIEIWKFHIEVEEIEILEEEE